MMNHYVDKTDGASIERKESSIVFHYGEADPQFSNIIVRELAK
jgi:trehalose-6-phosphatase